MSLNLYKYHTNPETITGFDQLDTNPDMLDIAIEFYDADFKKVLELASQYLKNRNILPLPGTPDYVIAEWDTVDDFLIDMHGKFGPNNIMTVYRDNGQRSLNQYPSIDQFIFFDVFTPFEKKEIEKVIDYLQIKHGLKDRKKWKEFLYKLKNTDIHNAIIESILYGYEVGYMREFEQQIDRIISEFEIESYGRLVYNSKNILDATTCKYVMHIYYILNFYKSSLGKDSRSYKLHNFMIIDLPLIMEGLMDNYRKDISDAHNDALYANDHEASSNHLRELLDAIIG